jgi:hypothetical protein
MVKTHGTTRLLICVAFLLALVSLLPLAQASLLVPGGIVPPSPVFPTGTQKAMTSGTITAVSVAYSEWVYQDPTNNLPGCSGSVICLDFVFQFINNGTGNITLFTMSGFDGLLNLVDVGTDPFGVNDPSSIYWNNSLSRIEFNYAPFSFIAPGETTPLLVIETEAVTYTTGGTVNASGLVIAQDGLAQSAGIYVPVPVPEPSSLAMMGGGLAFAGALLRKVGVGRLT